MHESLRYLLLQVRNGDDPMREQEVRSFARVLDVPTDRIVPFDLLKSAPSDSDLSRHDVVFIGGSGHYSATATGDWIEQTLDGLRRIHDFGIPMFASCWGFQAMARAMGGTVVHDLDRAELGTHELLLTDAGKEDPIFSSLGDEFLGQMGHEDRVAELPPDAILLASTNRVANQAYRFADRPIYCTQFHPELNRADLLERVQVYPQYAEKIAKIPASRFGELCREAPETETLLRRFVSHVFGP